MGTKYGVEFCTKKFNVTVEYHPQISSGYYAGTPRYPPLRISATSPISYPVACFWVTCQRLLCEWSMQTEIDIEHEWREWGIMKYWEKRNQQNVNRKTHLIWFPVHHVLILYFLQTTRKHCMMPVDQLLCFLSRHLDLPGIADDDIVTTIRCHGPDLNI